MDRFRNTGFLLLFILLPQALNAQLISVRSEVSSDSMMIGDQLVLNIHVEADENLVFQMPDSPDSLGNLEVLAPLSADTTMLNGRLHLVHSYLFTGFESGRQMIPSIEVLYQFRESVDTARSMPLFIQVYEPDIDTTQQIKDIKPPINTPLNFREVLPWAGLTAGAAMILFVLFILIRRYLQRRRSPEQIRSKKMEPAHVIAFRELDLLKEKKLWESGDAKAYYTRLTAITRQYIERQYEIPAMESTSDEIIGAFRKSNTEGEILDDMLRDLLELADLVKFAKEDPLPVDNQTHLNNAYIFIQKTYPLFEQQEINEKPEGEEKGDE